MEPIGTAVGGVTQHPCICQREKGPPSFQERGGMDLKCDGKEDHVERWTALLEAERQIPSFDYAMHMQIHLYTHLHFPILSGYLISSSVERHLFGKL